MFKLSKYMNGCRLFTDCGLVSQSGMEGEQVDPSLDLSHLTEQEQSTILQVLQRDLDLRRLDEGRVRSEVTVNPFNVPVLHTDNATKSENVIG